MSDITVLAFTWNTQSLRLYETLDLRVVEEHRTESMTTWRYSGVLADFWPDLSEKIQEERPSIFVVSFQEGIRPGGYFHSHLLPEEMPRLGYRLFDRTTLMGVGQTTVTGLKNADPFVRGLRLSVYVRNDVDAKMRFPSATFTPSYFRNKGGVAVYLTLPNSFTLAIINTHFPFDSESLTATVQKEDLVIRQDAVLQQDRFYNQLYRALVMETPASPQYVLMMGDFNYRNYPMASWSAAETGKLVLEGRGADFDELRQEFTKRNVYSFEEGIDDRGPSFAPTCKMVKNRVPGDS